MTYPYKHVDINTDGDEDPAEIISHMHSIEVSLSMSSAAIRSHMKSCRRLLNRKKRPDYYPSTNADVARYIVTHVIEALGWIVSDCQELYDDYADEINEMFADNPEPLHRWFPNSEGVQALNLMDDPEKDATGAEDVR